MIRLVWLMLLLFPVSVFGQVPTEGSGEEPVRELSEEPAKEVDTESPLPAGLEIGSSGGDQVIYNAQGEPCEGFFPAFPQHQIVTEGQGVLRLWNDGGVSVALFNERGEFVYCSQRATECSDEGDDACVSSAKSVVRSKELSPGGYSVYVGSAQQMNSYLYVFDTTSVYEKTTRSERREIESRESIAQWVEENSQQLKEKRSPSDKRTTVFLWQNVMPAFGNQISVDGGVGPASYLVSGELPGQQAEAKIFDASTAGCVGYLELSPRIEFEISATSAGSVTFELIGDEAGKKKALLVRRLSDNQIFCLSATTQERLDVASVTGLYEVYIGGLEGVLKDDPYSLKIGFAGAQAPVAAALQLKEFSGASYYNQTKGMEDPSKKRKKEKEKKEKEKKEKSKAANYTPRGGEAFGAVVRLERKGQLACTGSLVEWRKGYAVLTAAHCLFVMTKDERFAGKSPSLKASGKGDVSLAVSKALLPIGFAECAQSKAPYEECKDKGDVALIPISRGEAERLFGPTNGKLFAWRLASEPPKGGCASLGFGHATDSKQKPGVLALSPESVGGVWSSDGKDYAHNGDSGSPVVQGKELSSKRPTQTEPKVIYFVVMGYSNQGRSKTTLIQPVWALRELLR